MMNKGWNRQQSSWDFQEKEDFVSFKKKKKKKKGFFSTVLIFRFLFPIWEAKL